MNSQRQYKISIQQFQVKLKKKSYRILDLYPACNQTFVFLGMLAKTDVLVHCDKNGKILHEYKFTCSVDSIAMLQLDKVIVPQTKLNQIAIFDLQTHQRTILPFHFLFEEVNSTQLFTFSITKYFCIAEVGNYNDHRLRLTYFAGKIGEESKALAVYQSDNEWSYEYVMKVGNKESMVVWFKPRQDQQFELKQFHLDGVNPKFTHYKTPNTIGLPYGKEKFQVAISQAWQVSSHQFCLVCLTEKSNYNLENQKDNNNNFIWDIETNKIRQTKFSFSEQYSEFLIDCFSIGRYSVFHTFSFHNGVAEPSPIFYVDNKEEKIMNTQKRQWKCSYLIKFSFPAYENELYIENEYENGEVGEFKMRIIKVIQQQN